MAITSEQSELGSSAEVQTRVIDADGHIFEPEATFASLDPAFYPRRPVMVDLPPDTMTRDSNRVWMIDGRAVPTLTGRGATFFTLPGSLSSTKKKVALADQTLQDVEARLRGMDQYGVAVQVIYPTMFLVSAVEDVALEGALYRAYNQYMSDVCSRSKGRLKWAALIPWRDPQAALKELQWASDRGAAGIFTMGVIFDHQLNDPLFFPIYEAAGEFDLPVCVHLGWGAPAATQLFSDYSFFCGATIPVIWGFVHVMASGLLGRFPKLRVGFIETGAEWVPYVVNQVRRNLEPVSDLRVVDAGAKTRRGAPSLYRDPIEWFRDGRAFVSFETDEDIPYILDHIGADGLMISTDYPHSDPSADENFVAKLQARTDLSGTVKEKLLYRNAEQFYRL